MGQRPVVKNPRATVALILAASVLIFVFSGTFVREVLYFLNPAAEGFLRPAFPEVWENIVAVLVGVLSGYVLGNSNDDKK